MMMKMLLSGSDIPSKKPKLYKKLAGYTAGSLTARASRLFENVPSLCRSLRETLVKPGRFPWIEPLHRICLSIFGSFAVAAASAAALALIIAADGWDSPANAFIWASYVAFFVYFAAAVWSFSAQSLLRVQAAFGAVILAGMAIIWTLGGDANFGYGAWLTDFVLLVLLCGSIWLGFAGLALSQDKHWAAVAGERKCPPLTRFALRRAGMAFLAVSVILTLARDGMSFGLLLWPMAAFAGALAISLTIAYRPRLMAGVAQFARDTTTIDEEATPDAV